LKKVDELNINELNIKIHELSNVKVMDYDMIISLDNTRWIGDGSGTIKFKNISIKFYIDKNIVIYRTEDNELLNTFSEIKLDLKLKEIWKLKNQIDLIFSSYY